MIHSTKAQKAKSDGVLGLAIIELCNFQCVHCYLERMARPKINLEIAKAIAAIAADYGFVFVYITGGEPLLHPQFQEIYETFRRSGYIITLYSNGSLFKEQTFELFSALAPHSIEITMYGMSEATYSRMTKIQGQFQRVLCNIKRLKSLDINVVLKYNLVSITRDDFKDFLKFASSVDCDVAVNAQIIPILNGNQEPLKYRLSPTEIAQIGKEFGFNFSPSCAGFNGCDAGRNLFIDSQGQLRGCPVLQTDFDPTVLDKPDEAISRISSLFEEFHRRRTRPLCPAWLKLEGEKHVVNFLDELTSSYQ